MCSDITVIIPAYNAASTMARALDSVASQTQRPLEIIVVNDGSSDATAEVVRQHALHKTSHCRLLSIENSGVAIARNAGIRAATTGHVALLDADDEWEPDHLASLEMARAERPDAVVYWTGIRRIFSKGAAAEEATLPDFTAIARRHAVAATGQFLDIGLSAYNDLIRGNFINPSASMFKRLVKGDLSLFRERVHFAEDRLFFLELMGHGKFIFVDRETSVIHRDGSNVSMTTNRAQQLRTVEQKLVALQHIGRLPAITSDPSRLTIWRGCMAAAIRERVYYSSFYGLRAVVEAISKSAKDEQFSVSIHAAFIAKSLVRAARNTTWGAPRKS